VGRRSNSGAGTLARASTPLWSMTRIGRASRKKDVKNEDWSQNVVENKAQVFHRPLLLNNLVEDKGVAIKLPQSN
jgi:hypothetical protein